MEIYTAEHLQSVLLPRPVRFVQSIGSTNDLAREWLQQGGANGAVVIADEQVQGRGRMGRSWFTPPGTALILSLLLRPPVTALHQVTMLGAVSIAEMLDQLGAHSVAIKWPNDVLLNGRKVSGILPETTWDGSRLVGVVLGIGVNVRIDFTGTNLAATAISIEPALGRPINRVDLLKMLLDSLDRWSLHLGTEVLFEAWRARLVTLGTAVLIDHLSGQLHGFAESVDPSGVLRVRDASGRLHTVMAGDVSLGEPD